MSRPLYLIAFVALLAGGFALTSDPDPARMAAAQLGSLLREPADLPPDVDWREALAPGDTVELDGEQAEVVAVDSGEVSLRSSRGGETTTVPSTDLGRLVEKRPLWRYLTEGSAARTDEGGELVIWVRGYRMGLANTGWKDMRLHARAFESVVRSLRSIGAEHGFEFKVYEKNHVDFPGLTMLGQHDLHSLSVEFELPDGTIVGAVRPWTAPGRATLLPSLLAILAAVLFRRPLLALLFGVLVAAFLDSRNGGGPWFAGFWRTPVSVPLQLVETLSQPTHAVILGFLASALAMIGVMQAAGGMQGLMRLLSRWARSARSCQAATYLMGLVVFFDHYANTVLVGATMRPISDRFRIAREKLAYLVDSTAAPVAGLSLFSTWIAFEVSAYSTHLPDAAMASTQGYEVFLRTLPFRFYSLFTLMLVGLVVLTGRDFGPMLRAERRARAGQLVRPGARPGSTNIKLAEPRVSSGRARAAVRPLLAFVAVAILSTLSRGGWFASTEPLTSFARLREALYLGSGSTPLLFGALAGLGTALVEAWLAGLRSATLGAAWNGVRSAGTVLGLLCLAWMFGALCKNIGTASFLAVLLQEGPNPLLLPVILFGLSALIAFATGSSWSTMTILLPLVVGIAYEAGANTPVGAEVLVIITIGSVLEGAIFGDHCSPIADSTIMSSIATRSDHMDHVRTQAPYAILAMFVAIVCGYVPVVIFGLWPGWSLAGGAAMLTAYLFLWGRRVEARGSSKATADPESEPPALDSDPADPGGALAA